jgi:hypothetical protein
VGLKVVERGIRINAQEKVIHGRTLHSCERELNQFRLHAFRVEEVERFFENGPQERICRKMTRRTKARRS